MKTYMAKKNKLEKRWFIADADGKTLGKLAVRVATILRGKHKPEYTPHVDCGDGVIVINSDKIRVTGKKMTDKEYVTYSGYPGGKKIRTLDDMMKRDSKKVIHRAVRRMIPDTPLGRDMIKKLRICTGAVHAYKAQNPQELKI